MGLWSWLEDAAEEVAEVAEDCYDYVEDTVEDAADYIEDEVIEPLVDAVEEVEEWIGGNVADVTETLKHCAEFVLGVAEKVVGSLDEAYNAATEFASNLWNWATETAGDAWDTIKERTEEAWQWLEEHLDDARLADRAAKPHTAAPKIQRQLLPAERGPAHDAH